MPNYIADGNGSWFRVSVDTQSQFEKNQITLSTAISGVSADQQA